MDTTVASRATTRGIEVTVRTSYVSEQSEPAKGHWLFAYHIRIRNGGPTAVQLISRHWVITDAHDNVEEVRGPGVVGQQPVLTPGECHEYTSYCPLPTPFGSMEGSYQMMTMDGVGFDVEVARFHLSQPLAVN